MAKVYLGTSGWNYKHWRNGVFYPEDRSPSTWLDYFARHFNTVEINNTFYRLPGERTFQNWRTQVPPEFVFSIKASRFLTHIKRLEDPGEPLALFFSRARHLKDRLGPVLFQLPPRFKLNLERLEIFLAALKPYMTQMQVRCAMEFRHRSWLAQPVFDLLRKHHVSLCFDDWRDLHVTGPVTAGFIYIRRHYGSAGGGNYSGKELNGDVRQIRSWLGEDLDVYMYFNNDMGGFAVRNAKYVQKLLANGGSGRRKQAARSTRRRDSSLRL